jgi:hypothetical protein
MPKSPLASVNERFKNKEALIDAVKALATDELWVDRVNADKGLPRISNRKLIHLHDVLSQVKKDHGSRSKLIDSLIETQKRGKDAGYRTRLEGRSTPELLAMYQLAQKKAAPKKAKVRSAPKAAAPVAVKAPTKVKARASNAPPRKSGAPPRKAGKSKKR